MKKPQWYIPVEKRSRQDLSLDAINSMLWDAVQKTFSEDKSEAYLQEVFPAYLIYRKDEKYWQVGWSILDGEVKLGSEKKEVEKLLRGRKNTAVLRLNAEVCLHCGERLYAEEAVRFFEKVRNKLKYQELSGFQPLGQSFKVEDG